MYFVDTSALVKAYIEESGSETVQEAFGILDRSVAVSTLVAAETLGMFGRLRRRRTIRERVYRRAKDDFLNHYRTRYYVVHPDEGVMPPALSLIDAHHERSVGAMDVVHLCTAEYLQSLIPAYPVSIMCSDAGFSTLAQQRGFDVFDPTRDPISALSAPKLFP